MATASRLKTVDGKYYATEDYVREYIDENINEEILSGDIGDAISGAISGQVNPRIDALQSNVNEINQTMINFFSMNTL